MTTEQNKEEICRLDGEIRNKTVLRAGMLSGKLTHHKGVRDITSCIKRCCSNDKCHVAMMMAGKCFSVFCTNPQWCEPKDAPVETHHTNPTVAYVKRGDITFGNLSYLFNNYSIERALEHMLWYFFFFFFFFYLNILVIVCPKST